MILFLRYWKFAAAALAIVAALIWHLSRLEYVRVEERAACQARIDKSIADAKAQDAKTAQEAITRMAEDLRRAHQRAVAADKSREEAEHEIAALAPELAACRRPSDSDWRRLQ